jgi:hypothetical protein
MNILFFAFMFGLNYNRHTIMYYSTKFTSLSANINDANKVSENILNNRNIADEGGLSSGSYVLNQKGMDNRYRFHNLTINEPSLYQLRKNYEKHKLLNELNSKDVGLVQKLALINKESPHKIKPINLKAGGLINDFDFDF